MTNAPQPTSLDVNSERMLTQRPRRQRGSNLRDGHRLDDDVQQHSGGGGLDRDDAQRLADRSCRPRLVRAGYPEWNVRIEDRRILSNHLPLSFG